MAAINQQLIIIIPIKISSTNNDEMKTIIDTIGY